MIGEAAQLLSVAPLPVTAAIKEAVYPPGPLFQLKSIPILMPFGPAPEACAGGTHRITAGTTRQPSARKNPFSVMIRVRPPYSIEASINSNHDFMGLIF